MPIPADNGDEENNQANAINDEGRDFPDEEAQDAWSIYVKYGNYFHLILALCFYVLKFINYRYYIIYSPHASRAEKMNFLKSDPNVLWRPHHLDLHMARLPVQGLCFYISVELNSMSWRYCFPRKLASAEVPHISLSYGATFASYKELNLFKLRARRLLSAQHLQGRDGDLWIFLRIRDNGTNPICFVPESSDGGTLLREIQDLIPGARDPVNLHISCRNTLT